MDYLTALMNEPVVRAIGWALIHSLWQGTLIACLLAVTLRFSRGRTEPPFAARDRQLLGRLTPHLRRAIQIYARLQRNTSERDVYAGAVDGLSVATIILDEQARLLNSNAMASALLDQADGLSLRGRRLPHDPSVLYQRVRDPRRGRG